MDTTTNFLFYGSWLEDTEDMSKEELLEYLQAICEYGLKGTERPVRGYVKGCMRMVKRDIDANKQRQEESANAHREAGKKGGRPRKTENQNNQMVSNENQNNQMVFEETKKSINKILNIKDKKEKKEIILLFPKKKNDSQHNTTGLIEELRHNGIPDEGIQRICELCDYGRIGHPIWEVLNNARSRRKIINETYITNYITNN